MRREDYQYQEQSPLDHIENLDRYLLIASLIPMNPALCYFRIRHPDIQPGNLIVSRSLGSNWHVIGLLDWQHVSILPPFLLADTPECIQNYDDPISQSMAQPSLPENWDDLDERQKSRARGLYRRRLTHYHYVKNTAECNKLHYAALTDPISVLRRCLFYCAGDTWEDETRAESCADRRNGELEDAYGRRRAEDIHETMKLDGVQTKSDETLESFRNLVGFAGQWSWMPNENYEAAVALRKMVEAMLAATETEADRNEIVEHWVLDDIDEEKYM